MTPKELKKLAAACRSAGISQFKNADVEFTLSDSAPVTRKRREKKNSEFTASYDDVAKSFETDTLSSEDLLFWSTGTPPATDEDRSS